MRSLRLLALLAPALLLPVACEASSSSSGGVFNPEAGPGFEAGPPSGPLPEAGADVVVPPAGVTVTVIAGLAPKKDARVITHDATGAVLADLRTDAAGKVSLATAPSMVTLLTQHGAGISATFWPMTFVGVADGDDLVFDATDPELASTPTLAGSFTVSLGQPYAGSTDYGLRVGHCSTTTNDFANPRVFEVWSDCVGNQNAILVAARTDDVDIGYGFVKNVAKPAVNGTVAVGPITNVVATGLTTIDATNVPGDAESFGDLYAVANGLSFYAVSEGGALGDGGLSFKTATGFADAYQSMIAVRTYLDEGSQTRYFVRREATTAPASATLPAFDFATSLPSVTGTTLTTTVPARAEVALTSDKPLTGSDGAFAELYWYPGSEQGGRWTLMLPPTTTAFKLPALPADAASFVPTSAIELTELTFVEATHLPGYKELKALPLAPGGHHVLDAGVPLPAAGTVRLSRWSVLGPG